MAIHPSAIPSSEELRETIFDKYYYPYKKQIFGAFALFLAICIAVLGYRQWRDRETRAQWNRFAIALTIEPESNTEAAERGAREEQIRLLERLVKDYPNAPVTPWAMQQIVTAKVALRLYAEARTALEDMRTRFPTAVISTVKGTGAGSLADDLDAKLKQEQEWQKANTYQHPEPAAGRMALVETTAGKFWLAFYPQHAPRHVERFVSNAKRGLYNGTQVYRVLQREALDKPLPLRFELGSAASRLTGPAPIRDPSTYDRDDPDDVQDPEAAQFDIRHRRGIVSAVTLPSGEAGLNFQVVCSPAGMESTLDGNTTPFAAIVDREGSLETIDRICLAPTYGTASETKDLPGNLRVRDVPFPRIVIRRVTIWSDEKPEDGHTWDTSRRNSSEPEPWEAALVAAWGVDDVKNAK